MVLLKTTIIYYKIIYIMCTSSK